MIDYAAIPGTREWAEANASAHEEFAALDLARTGPLTKKFSNDELPIRLFNIENRLADLERIVEQWISAMKSG